MHRHRFDTLLGALVLLLLSAPVVRLFLSARHPYFARITVAVCFSLMLISAVFAISERRRTVVVALSLAVPAILLGGLNVMLNWRGVEIAYHLLGVSFLGYTVVVILGFLFREQRVTFNMIFASMCVYLLLGVLWAEVYSLLEILEPKSFKFAYAEEANEQGMQFGGEKSVFPLYYSLVTMTTLGYGDIVPTSSASRMFAAVQA
ncbi:MAG: ion channel, partial [Planctomycetota bacterium]